MIFRMYCTCGAGGSMREVSATRKIHCPPVRSYGDMRAKPEPVNVCSRCGKVCRRWHQGARCESWLNSFRMINK